jgi:hypothetical protein
VARLFRRCSVGVVSRSFSLPKVSQKCSQLIQSALVASPVGLRLEIKNRQEKMNFIGNFISSRPKIFLTRKRSERVRENKKEIRC